VVAAHPVKYFWFLKHGYRPHIWQALFHSAQRGDTHLLSRFRHLVAGRRGGKTLSAAWETLFYALHPQEFHRDAHGVESNRAPWIWCLAKDHKMGRPQLLTFIDVMDQAGLVKDKDYRYNKTEKVIEFTASGTLVEFKSADDPQSLRGAGLDILWIDEAAFVPNKDAWSVVRPALSDKLGLLITTTTPWGKNWFHQEFWSDAAMLDEKQFRVEYTSIDNPYFSSDEWFEAKLDMHPVLFAQEYLAAFDAMAGVDLPGEWLKYFVFGNPDIKGDDIGIPMTKDGKYALRLYLGVDPAISLKEDADNFAMALLGITKDGTQGFLLDYFLGHIAFPDQLDKIREWQLKYRPELIGIEANAYQVALAQQAARLEGFPGIVPVMSKGKKNDRILSMSPLFKIGKIRINRKHAHFIDQWVSFDKSKTDQNDDLLDAVEIALGVAGTLLPMMPSITHFHEGEHGSLESEAAAHIRSHGSARSGKYDPELGIEA
jgi:phage terminase large subunit-like protein